MLLCVLYCADVCLCCSRVCTVQTPLHLAVEAGAADIVKLLLHAGKAVFWGGGRGVTRRHIRHTSMALPTGIVPAETLRWGKPQPPVGGPNHLHRMITILKFWDTAV